MRSTAIPRRSGAPTPTGRRRSSPASSPASADPLRAIAGGREDARACRPARRLDRARLHGARPRAARRHRRLDARQRAVQRAQVPMDVPLTGAPSRLYLIWITKLAPTDTGFAASIAERCAEDGRVESVSEIAPTPARVVRAGRRAPDSAAAGDCRRAGGARPHGGRRARAARVNRARPGPRSERPRSPRRVVASMSNCERPDGARDTRCEDARLAVVVVPARFDVPARRPGENERQLLARRRPPGPARPRRSSGGRARVSPTA